MNFIAALFAVPLIIWGCLWVVRGSVVLGIALYLIAASAIGPQFASFDIGVTMSIDRLLLLALLGGFAYRLAFHLERPKAPNDGRRILDGGVCCGAAGQYVSQ